MRRPSLVVTTGEPAGIGPDICLALAATEMPMPVTILGDRDLLRERAARICPDAPFPDVEHVPLRVPCVPGRLDPANSAYVLELLDQAVDGCRSGRFAAMVTAPVHKGI
ncbi:MAG: 4-hydroxythreonine-4-phosphate dehydrogenase PdxA, partial [Rhodocyclaceae bacterium]|nr:4-hydroxythreonine-4-phosphate dehydrogenase PdxA [Rhodocyclaceae bacterium]